MKGYMRIILTLTLGMVMSSLWAQVGGLELRVENEGEYIYWLIYKDAQGFQQSTEPAKLTGRSVRVDASPLQGRLQEAAALVLDAESGNVAQKPIPSSGTGVVTIQRSDFTLVRKVRVRIVTPDGKDIEFAKVALSDPKGWSATRVLDPASQGVAEFLYVPAGASRLRVMYGDAKGRQSVETSLDVPLERVNKDFAVTLSVDGSKGTLSAAPPPSGEKEPSANTPRPTETPPLPLPTGTIPTGSAAPTPLRPMVPGNNPAVALIGTVLGLMLLVGGIAFGLKRMKEKGETVDSVLSKVGVDLPKEPAPISSDPDQARPEPVEAEGVCEFCGMLKDPATGACECTVAEAGPLSPVGAGTPRLIGIKGTLFGQTYPLQPGTIAIGRDETNAIAMPDPTVSRKHAQVVVHDGSFVIRDLGSSNGTFVNGARITEHMLHPGDEVQVGSTKFRFEVS